MDMIVGSEYVLLVFACISKAKTKVMFLVNAYILPNKVNTISIIMFCVVMDLPKENIIIHRMFSESVLYG